MTESPPVALVGCGNWGRNALRDLVALGCRVAVADPDPARRHAATAAGACVAVADLADLPPVLGAVVATPTVTHAAVAHRLLDRGLPLFVEKPLTPDPEAARRLVARAAGRLFVMEKWRYHPGVEELARVARGGDLGPVLGLRTVRVDWGCPHADVDPVWILAPHDLSIGREVLGSHPTPAAARAAVVGGRAVALTGLLGGEAGSPWQTIEVSACSPVRRREVELVCRDGSAVLGDAYLDAVHVVRADGSREVRPVSAEPPLLRELAAFVTYLKGGPPPKSTGADGLAVVEAIARLRELAGVQRVRKEAA